MSRWSTSYKHALPNVMSDDQTNGGVRRFGRRDRKRSLDPRGPLFPPEDLTEETNLPAEMDEQEPPVEADAFEIPEPPVEVLNTPVIQEPKSKPASKPVQTAPRQPKHILANLLTILFLLGTVGMAALVVTIAQNPYTPLNPFPPFTPLPIVITATFLPPTALPTGTIAPTATFTPLAVDASGTLQAVFSFKLAHEQPVYAPNANEKGCNWSSIGGTVTDAQGGALDGYRVHVTGNNLNETVFSGAALTFGAGGFELFLTGTPQAQTYSVQLLDPQSKPLSPVYSVATKESCDQNVAVLQFVQQ
jgi:hypothetical protein